jgi:acyl carrier protein
LPYSDVSDSDVSASLIGLLTDHLRTVPGDVDWDTASLTDLGLDSMTAIELVLHIEDAFGIRFPEERLVQETFATFPALRAAVESLVAQA